MSHSIPAVAPGVNSPLDRVRALVALGASIGDAIRIVIGGSIPKWAARHGLSRTPASMTVNGSRVPPDERTLAALVKDLECTELEIRELLGEGAKRRAMEMAS